MLRELTTFVSCIFSFSERDQCKRAKADRAVRAPGEAKNKDLEVYWSAESFSAVADDRARVCEGPGRRRHVLYWR